MTLAMEMSSPSRPVVSPGRGTTNMNSHRFETIIHNNSSHVNYIYMNPSPPLNGNNAPQVLNNSFSPQSGSMIINPNGGSRPL